MIHLRPITVPEFPLYRSYFVADYSRELVENDGLEAKEARRRAEVDVDRSFPGGVPLPQNRLWCLEEEGGPGVLGYLWVVAQGDNSLFVMDFFVVPDHRGRGHGRAALAALDQVARDEGRSLRLRVARSNPRALALYEQAGYQITGYNMAKAVGINPPRG